MFTPRLLGFMAQACHEGEGLPPWLCTCSCLTSQFLLQGCLKPGSENTWWEGARAGTWERATSPPPPAASFSSPNPQQLGGPPCPVLSLCTPTHTA